MCDPLDYSLREMVPTAPLEVWRNYHIAQRRQPRLKHIVWQATVDCNLRCRHCFVEDSPQGTLDTQQITAIFRRVAEEIDCSKVRVGISGGEPTMRKDLAEVVALIKRLGFSSVVLASNGFLLGHKPELLDALVEAGLAGLNISLDGNEDQHNWLRRHPSAYRLARRAVEYARHRHPGLDTNLTIAISPRNLASYTEVVDYAESLGIRIVKIVAVMPYGEARQHPQLYLDDRQFHQLLTDVSRRRASYSAGQSKTQVCYTDDGFLGCFEDRVRQGIFQCPAGVSMATIHHNGMLGACPAIDKKFNYQGDLRRESLHQLWKTGFQAFRQRSWLRRGACAHCSDWRYCMGGSMHDREENGHLSRCNALRLRQVMMEKCG